MLSVMKITGQMKIDFCGLQKRHDLLSLFPLYPPTLLPQAMSSTCLMTMLKHVRRYLGNWRTTTWCLPLWFRSTGAGPGLYAVQPSLQSSWTEVMVSKHFLYLSLDWKTPSRLSAGCNLIVPTEKQTLVLLCHEHICNFSIPLDMTSHCYTCYIEWNIGFTTFDTNQDKKNTYRIFDLFVILNNGLNVC